MQIIMYMYSLNWFQCPTSFLPALQIMKIMFVPTCSCWQHNLYYFFHRGHSCKRVLIVHRYKISWWCPDTELGHGFAPLTYVILVRIRQTKPHIQQLVYVSLSRLDAGSSQSFRHHLGIHAYYGDYGAFWISKQHLYSLKNTINAINFVRNICFQNKWKNCSNLRARELKDLLSSLKGWKITAWLDERNQDLVVQIFC